MAAKKTAKKKVTIHIDADVLADLANALKALADLHAAVLTGVDDPADRATLQKKTRGKRGKKR
jgi:hypothetical protein